MTGRDIPRIGDMVERCRGVIFDVDGTLIDTRSAHLHAWEETIASFGITASRKALESYFGKRSDYWAAVLLPQGSEKERRKSTSRCAGRQLRPLCSAGRAAAPKTAPRMNEGHGYAWPSFDVAPVRRRALLLQGLARPGLGETGSLAVLFIRVEQRSRLSGSQDREEICRRIAAGSG